jgi:hypothetical protein
MVNKFVIRRLVIRRLKNWKIVLQSSKVVKLESLHHWVFDIRYLLSSEEGRLKKGLVNLKKAVNQKS